MPIARLSTLINPFGRDPHIRYMDVADNYFLHGLTINAEAGWVIVDYRDAKPVETRRGPAFEVVFSERHPQLGASAVIVESDEVKVMWPPTVEYGGALDFQDLHEHLHKPYQGLPSEQDEASQRSDFYLFGNAEHWEILDRALKQWGAHEQMQITVGELGELLALFGAYVQGRTSEEDWIDEIAGSLITLHQLAHVLVDPERLRERIELKLDRLETKLDTCQL